MANQNPNPGISEGQSKGAREVQNGPGTSYYTRKQGSALKNVGMSRGQRSQLEGAISGQIWGNLIMKIMKDSNELQSVGRKIRICGFIPIINKWREERALVYCRILNANW